MIDKQSDWEVRLRIILKSFYEDMISIDIDTGKYIKNERDTFFMHPRWTKEDYSSAWKAVSYRSTIEEITKLWEMLQKRKEKNEKNNT